MTMTEERLAAIEHGSLAPDAESQIERKKREYMEDEATQKAEDVG